MGNSVPFEAELQDLLTIQSQQLAFWTLVNYGKLLRNYGKIHHAIYYLWMGIHPLFRTMAIFQFANC